MSTTPSPLARVLAAPERITCQGCRRVGSWPPVAQDGAAFTEVAKAAGWRIWDGQTIGGAPVAVRLCPVCIGAATPEQEQAMCSHQAGCHVCGADMLGESDEPSDYGPPLSADAERWTVNHRCEKDTYITKPAGVS